jgi:hypothetical protein
LGEYFSNLSQILFASVVIGQFISEKPINWKIAAAGLIAAAVSLLFALWWLRKK